MSPACKECAGVAQGVRQAFTPRDFLLKVILTTARNSIHFPTYRLKQKQDGLRPWKQTVTIADKIGQKTEMTLVTLTLTL